LCFADAVFERIAHGGEAVVEATDFVLAGGVEVDIEVAAFHLLCAVAERRERADGLVADGGAKGPEDEKRNGEHENETPCDGALEAERAFDGCGGDGDQSG
jgi:hypothetical protein